MRVSAKQKGISFLVVLALSYPMASYAYDPGTGGYGAPPPVACLAQVKGAEEDCKRVATGWKLGQDPEFEFKYHLASGAMVTFCKLKQIPKAVNLVPGVEGSAIDISKRVFDIDSRCKEIGLATLYDEGISRRELDPNKNGWTWSNQTSQEQEYFIRSPEENGRHSREWTTNFHFSDKGPSQSLLVREGSSGDAEWYKLHGYWIPQDPDWVADQRVDVDVEGLVIETDKFITSFDKDGDEYKITLGRPKGPNPAEFYWDFLVRSDGCCLVGPDPEEKGATKELLERCKDHYKSAMREISEARAIGANGNYTDRSVIGTAVPLTVTLDQPRIFRHDYKPGKHVTAVIPWSVLSKIEPKSACDK